MSHITNEGKFEIHGVEWLPASRPNSDFDEPDFTVDADRFNPLYCLVKDSAGNPVSVERFTISVVYGTFVQVTFTLRGGESITCDIDRRCGPLKFGAVREKDGE